MKGVARGITEEWIRLSSGLCFKRIHLEGSDGKGIWMDGGPKETLRSAKDNSSPSGMQ